MASVLSTVSLSAGESQSLAYNSIPTAQFDFGGPIGERMRANLDNWLLRAPQANPGMIEMFRVRDRQPVPEIVPWAGEFAGKYLISAVQALRMSNDPRLQQQVRDVVSEFISTQADDGYLGPFRKAERLRGHWDLWGHYHAIAALVLWYQHSGDPAALSAARKAADLVCATYLDTGHRVIEAGDPEMNMSILTGLAMLHRLTGEPRYLRMAMEVQKDWERAGDYLRAGLDGREFYRSPRPRWESLHDLQGLVEMWRVTGDSYYRQAFEHHWRSIRRWDRRNTGGFSSGEQATGNPYAPSAIETCCTVAWMALTVDYLRLTGEPYAADDLELATLNAGLGAQHPSGRWWTYNTPMDGIREASAHTIVFQSRAGTPELNCCSVNAPRVLGSLTDWAVMSTSNTLVLNWLGTMRCKARLPDGQNIEIISNQDAWQEGKTEVRILTSASNPLTLQIRIPHWSLLPSAEINGAELSGITPGSYFNVTRKWADSDKLVLTYPPGIRAIAGANEAAGKVSLYRGPILMTYDQAHNPFDENSIPPLDLSRLDQAKSPSMTHLAKMPLGLPSPWVRFSVPTVGGGWMDLIDFASAGALGTHYRSWLEAKPSPAPPAFTQVPPDGAHVRPGQVRFQWRASRGNKSSYRVEFAERGKLPFHCAYSTNVSQPSITLDSEQLATQVKPVEATLWWRVVCTDSNGDSAADVPPAWFKFDQNAPAQILKPEVQLGAEGELIRHSLRGDRMPEWGELKSPKMGSRAQSGTQLDGKEQMLVYTIPEWPDEDFSVSVRFQISNLPQSGIGQVFSGWCAGMDDPLRLVVQEGKLFARIEAGNTFSTPGVPLETNRWYSITAVKQAGKLTLFVDGRKTGECGAPIFNNTQATDCALGGNPHFGGKEFLAARFADFTFWSRAISTAEVKEFATSATH